MAWLPMEFAPEGSMHIDRGAEVSIGFIATGWAPEQLPPFDELAGALAAKEPLSRISTSGAVC